jgi:hypothetical protein
VAELPPQPQPPPALGGGPPPNSRLWRSTGPKKSPNRSPYPLPVLFKSRPKKHLHHLSPRKAYSPKDQLSRAISLPIKKSSLAHHDHPATLHRHRSRPFIHRTVSSRSLSHPLLGISDPSHSIHPLQAPKRATSSNSPPSGPTHRLRT